MANILSPRQSAHCIFDTALDDLVSSNRKPRAARGGRGAGNSQPQQRRSGGSAGVHAKAAALGQASLGNAAAISANNRNRGPVVIPGRAPGGGSFGSKIIVSNLPIDVTEPQVKVRRRSHHLFAHTLFSHIASPRRSSSRRPSARSRRSS